MNVNQNTVKSLMHAAERGDIRRMEHCLKSVPIDATDDQSQVALHFASSNGHEDIVRLLIKKGASLECPNWSGWKPIMFAAYYGHSTVVALLVHNNAKVNCENSRLATPLICASRCGHKGVIEVLLENGAEINPKPTSKVSLTALMTAAQHGHLLVVNLLLQYGANVDYKNPDTGYTALMLAALNGHLKIVEMLIEKGGADPNLTNTLNQTALDLATVRGRNNVRSYLNNKTLKESQSPSKSQPTLINAAKAGKFKLVQELLNAGIDVNMKDGDGATPLIYACIGGHKDVTKMLLMAGANTDTQDLQHGWTALMQATFKKHVEVVKLLLKAQADINIKNNDGLTVFDLASIVGIPEITRLLIPAAYGMHISDEADKENKGNVKNWISKVGDKMGINKRNPNTLSRVAVQRSDILDQEEEFGELRKTSSVMSALDAQKSLSNGSAKAKITLVSPQVKLPDDVVAPVVSPYSQLPSFNLPKMSIMGSKLSSSNGSAGETTPENSSYDTASFKALQNNSTNNTRNIKRPQMSSNMAFAAHQPEPDSPQSSMTSSGFTSVSQYRGPGVMPQPIFRRKQPNSTPQTMEFSSGMSSAWASQQPTFNYGISNLLGNNQHLHQVMMNHSKQSPSPLPLPKFATDMSIRSVSSVGGSEAGDIETLLQKLSLEKYRSTFEEEEVDYETLLEMDDNDLKMMGIDQTINRDRILLAVNEKQKRGGSRSLHNTPVNSVYTPVSPTGKSTGGSIASVPGHVKLAPLPAFISQR